MSELPSFLDLIQERTGKSLEELFKNSDARFDKDGNLILGDFNVSASGIDNSDKVGLTFKDGNFELPPQLRAGMVNFGAQMNKLARNLKIDLTQTREFAGAQNLDGKAGLSDQEVGALLLASSLNHLHINLRGYESSTLESNDVTTENLEKLGNGGKAAELAKKVAEQILGDNRFPVSTETTSPQANATFGKIMTDLTYTPGQKC